MDDCPRPAPRSRRGPSGASRGRRRRVRKRARARRAGTATPARLDGGVAGVQGAGGERPAKPFGLLGPAGDLPVVDRVVFQAEGPLGALVEAEELREHALGELARTRAGPGVRRGRPPWSRSPSPRRAGTSPPGSRASRAPRRRSRRAPSPTRPPDRCGARSAGGPRRPCMRIAASAIVMLVASASRSSGVVNS